MIKIRDLPEPKELTLRVVTDKTKRFIDSNKKKVVWDDKYFKRQLAEMSYGKCCYCECTVGKEGNYLVVEHFKPKDKYPDEVVKWSNLLPSCARCNSWKGAHDTSKEPIINPRYEDPGEHLRIHDSVYYQKTEKGRLTYNVLGLNDTLVLKERVLISVEAIKSFQSHIDEAERLLGNKTQDSLTLAKLRNGIVDLFREAQCDSPYSAAVATSIISHPNYGMLEQYLTELNIWESVKDVVQQAEENALL